MSLIQRGVHFDAKKVQPDGDSLADFCGMLTDAAGEDQIVETADAHGECSDLLAQDVAEEIQRECGTRIRCG